MKVEVYIYSWNRFLANTKHNYVKILVDGVLKEEQGGVHDRLTFWTPKQAQDWVDKYVLENFPDEEIRWKYLGDVETQHMMAYAFSTIVVYGAAILIPCLIIVGAIKLIKRVSR